MGTMYVSGDNGNDSWADGTEGRPFSSIKAAVAECGPGEHTLVLDRGSYGERVRILPGGPDRLKLVPWGENLRSPIRVALLESDRGDVRIDVGAGVVVTELVLPPRGEAADASRVAVMADAIDTRDLVTREFQLRAATLNTAARTVEAVLATEQPVEVFDWQGWGLIQEVLLMSGLRMPPSKQVPLLDSHNRESLGMVLGSTRDLRVEGDKLVGTRHFGTSKAAADAWSLVRDGHITDGSVGYRVLDKVDIPAGRADVVNDRGYTAPDDMPLRVVLEWELREDSLVWRGADDAAKMRAIQEAEGEACHGGDNVRTLRFSGTAGRLPGNAVRE